MLFVSVLVVVMVVYLFSICHKTLQCSNLSEHFISLLAHFSALNSCDQIGNYISEQVQAFPVLLLDAACPSGEPRVLWLEPKTPVWHES